MVNSRSISDLHPTLQRGVTELIRRMKLQGYDVITPQTYRDKEYQNSIFAQGRTKPGKVVTNARGGESMHNYRLAFDICKNVKGHEYDDSKFFDTAGKIWTEMGGTWGGNWKGFQDRVHMEYTGGLTLAQLQAGRTMPANTKMLWESKATSTPTQDLTPEQAVDLICKKCNFQSPNYWKGLLNDTPYFKEFVLGIAKVLK